MPQRRRCGAHMLTASLPFPCWTADDIDLARPSTARRYDFYLGGASNFAADRNAAQACLDAAPFITHAARANRAFLRRTVRYAADHGIRQFLDLRCGIPNIDPIHEYALRIDPSAHVVAVDNDPIAFYRAYELTRDHPHAGVVDADIRDMPRTLDRITDQRLLDFTRPIAVLLLAVAHYIPQDMTTILAPLQDTLAAGSLLSISHATADPTLHPDQIRTVTDVYRATTGLHLRTPEQITAVFTGFRLLHPATSPTPQTPAELVAVNA